MPTLADGIRQKAEELATGYLASAANVGLVVGLLVGDGRHTFGFGKLAKGGDRTPDERTVFEIGSVTKVFTAVLLADMADNGEVRFDQPVRELLPAGTVVPKWGDREITLLDLSMHAAGLPRMPGNWELGMKSEQEPYANYTPELLYQALAATRLRWKPGTRTDYSNFGTGLLGFALARKAGKPYEELLAERVLRPLGLTDTSVTLSDDQKARMAQGHDESGNPTANWDIPTLSGAGALRSTAAEMLTFLRDNVAPTETPLARAIEECHRPQKLEWSWRAFVLAAVWGVALAALSVFCQWAIPVPPGSWKFLTVFLAPVILTRVLQGSQAALVASVAVWVGTLWLWAGTGWQFGWWAAACVLLAVNAVLSGGQLFRQTEAMPGWQSLRLAGGFARWHNGGTGGFRSFVGFVPESRVGVVVLSNSASDPDALAVELLRLLHDTSKGVHA
jgi:CubicO group peptidase (beta-lactamase class C family)